MHRLYLTIYLLLVAWLPACSQQSSKTHPADPALPKGVVLAVVNGEPITEAELNLQLEKLLDENAAFFSSVDLEKKVLETMINSRVMAQMQAAALTPEELENLELKVHDFRESLLVQGYLRSNMEQQAVTADQVKRYYEEHSDKFTEKGSKHFEYITTFGGYADKRDAILKALGELKHQPNWKQAVARLDAQGLPVVFKQATLKPELLESPLRTLVMRTAAGETSNVHIGESLMLVRVIEEKPSTLLPLASVSHHIRKTLATGLLKNAVKVASDRARADAKIEYFNE